MRVVLKHLKPLPNCRFKYRRAWPKDVRAVRPDLPLECKKTFDAPSEAAAIRTALDIDREFERVVAAARATAGVRRQDWKVAEDVAHWFEKYRPELETVVMSYETHDAHGTPMIVEETGADFERDRILADAEGREGLNALGHPAALTLEEDLKLRALKSGKPPTVPLTVHAAYEVYFEKHLRRRENKATSAAINQFIEFAGDVPLARVNRRLVHDWMDWLMNNRDQAAATIKRRIGVLKAVVNFVKDRELFEGPNPFERMQPPKIAKQPVKILPLHMTHLKALDTYLASSRRVHEETRQVMALLRLTGCRPSEIAGLSVEDLQLDGPIPYALVRWTEKRRLKNAWSERRVPLLDEALTAAHALKTARKTGWLFPKLAPSDAEANENQSLSNRMAGVFHRAGIPASPKLVGYSFRHTMAEALYQCPDITPDMRRRCLGKGASDLYGSTQQPLEMTRKAFEGAVPLLGRVDEVLYPPELLTITRPSG